jgi:hypothetical protein
MNDPQHNLAVYRQPAFVICTAVLALTGMGMSFATQRLGLYLKKEPLPLKRPLDAIEEGRLAPYKISAKVPIENADILKSLGTRDYIQWVLEDPRESVQSPVRKVLLFITYYRQRTACLIARRCYTGGVISDWRPMRSLSASASGDRREIPGRCLLFDRVSRCLLSVPQFPVVYLFHVNGEYAGSRDEAPAAQRTSSAKHAYFCKIELVSTSRSRLPRGKAADGGR